MHVLEAAPGARTTIDGREVDYFCGSSYLGLHGHPALAIAACEAVRLYGTGAATSRASSGCTPSVLEVEKWAARFFETESSVYFPSGYMSNSVILQGLKDHYDVIFVDDGSHYSVFDAVGVSGKPVYFFRSRDAHALQQKLRLMLEPKKRPLVICDGIYPADGEIAPLQDYDKVLSNYDDALFCVDDAHASGVIGERGLGSFEYCGLQGTRYLTSRTLSKAFGGYGGLIAGSKSLVSTLIAGASVLKGASPVPTPIAAATAKALEIAHHQPQLIDNLRGNVYYIKQAFKNIGMENIDDTPVPIISLSPKGVDLERLQNKLYQEGLVTLYLPDGAYTGVPKSGCIRISIFSDHTHAQIDRLVATIKEYL